MRIFLYGIGMIVLVGLIAGAVWYAKEPPIKVPKEIVNPPRLEVSASKPEEKPQLDPDSAAAMKTAIDAVVIEGGDKDFEAIDRDVNSL